MLQGCRREAWSHTGQILCLLANIHRDPQKRRQPFEPDEWNPYAERKAPTKLTPEQEQQIAEFDRLMLQKAFQTGARGRQ